MTDRLNSSKVIPDGTTADLTIEYKKDGLKHKITGKVKNLNLHAIYWDGDDWADNRINTYDGQMFLQFVPEDSEILYRLEREQKECKGSYIVRTVTPYAVALGRKITGAPEDATINLTPDGLGNTRIEFTWM